MGLDLRHRYQEVRFQHRSGKPKIFHPGVARLQRRADQFITIEINKSNLLIVKRLLIPALGKHQLGVALMSWSLGHHHGARAHPAKRFGSSKNQQCVRVDGIARNVIDQIGLEDHRLAPDINRKLPQALRQDLVNPLRVAIHMQNRDS